jgi:hypothetical protein
VPLGGQLPGVSRMVTVTEPSSAAVGAGAVSQGWKRSGSSSPGSAVHSQQMNRARLSSSHGVGGCRGGSLAVLSAARVAADGGPPPSNRVQSMWLIGPGPPPCKIQSQVRATRLSPPNSCHRGHLPRPGVPVTHHQPPPVLVPFGRVRGDVGGDLVFRRAASIRRAPSRTISSRPGPRGQPPRRLSSALAFLPAGRWPAGSFLLVTWKVRRALLQVPHPQLRVIPPRSHV